MSNLQIHCNAIKQVLPEAGENVLCVDLTGVDTAGLCAQLEAEIGFTRYVENMGIEYALRKYLENQPTDLLNWVNDNYHDIKKAGE